MSDLQESIFAWEAPHFRLGDSGGASLARFSQHNMLKELQAQQ